MSVVNSQLAARRRRAGCQRLRRRARGRADLRLSVREGQSLQAGAAPVAELDDHGRHEERLRIAASVRGLRAARAGRTLALGGRLDRRHERHPRRHDSPRSSFDGAVSLGRVQTPTLAIVARREEEIKAFVPEPYWLVDAPSTPGSPSAETAGAMGEGDGSPGNASRRVELKVRVSTAGRFHAGAKPRLATEERGARDRRGLPGQAGHDHKARQDGAARARPMLYDLTTLQREANTRYGFSARRTLAAAQRLYEEHKALTYPRTNSRYLTTDMVEEIKPTAELVGGQKEYAKAAAYVTALDLLPLARVVNDEKVTDHHAIIPTRAEHAVDRWVTTTSASTTWSCGASWPCSIPRPCSRTRAWRPRCARRQAVAAKEPDGAGPQAARRPTATSSARAASCCSSPAGAGSTARCPPRRSRPPRRDEGADQQLPKLNDGEDVQTLEIASERKETKPPRRYSDASLLGAMETAGKLVEDDELREAMKDSGIGTPATRAAIIERLIQVGYIERDGARSGGHREGPQRDQAARRARADIAGYDRSVGAPPRQDRARRGLAREVHGRHRGFRGADRQRARRETQGVRIPRANLGPCPVCGHDIKENRKGYSCWARDDPGCGFVIWKGKAGKQLPVAIARELIHSGYTAKAVTGLQGAQRAQLPRSPGPQPERGRQVARRVRRGVGE